MKTIVSAALFCVLVGVVCAQEKAVPVGEEGHHQLVLENEYTRVFHVVLAPKDSTLMHQHDRDYVYVMIGSSQVEVVKPGAAPTQMKLNDGDVKFTKGPLTHKVTNTGDTPFVNLTIEVKKASTKSVCGASWAGVEAEKPQSCEMTLVTGIAGQTYHLETDSVEARSWFTAGSGTGVTPGTTRRKGNGGALTAAMSLRWQSRPTDEVGRCVVDSERNCGKRFENWEL